LFEGNQILLGAKTQTETLDKCVIFKTETSIPFSDISKIIAVGYYFAANCFYTEKSQLNTAYTHPFELSFFQTLSTAGRPRWSALHHRYALLLNSTLLKAITASNCRPIKDAIKMDGPTEHSDFIPSILGILLITYFCIILSIFRCPLIKYSCNPPTHMHLIFLTNICGLIKHICLTRQT